MADVNGKEVAAFIQANDLLVITSDAEETILNMDAKTFPNPIINEILNIDLTTVKEKGMVELKIISIHKKTVHAENLAPGGIHVINIDDKHGMYLLVLKNRRGVHVGKTIFL